MLLEVLLGLLLGLWETVCQVFPSGKQLDRFAPCRWQRALAHPRSPSERSSGPPSTHPFAWRGPLGLRFLMETTSPSPGLDVPAAVLEPVLAELRAMDEDPRLGSVGVGAAFAAAFPAMPSEVYLSTLTATQWTRVAAAVQVPATQILDIKDLSSKDADSVEKSRRLRLLVEERIS